MKQASNAGILHPDRAVRTHGASLFESTWRGSLVVPPSGVSAPACTIPPDRLKAEQPTRHSCGAPSTRFHLRVVLYAILVCLIPSLQAASARVVITPAPGFSITWDGNNGGFSNPAVGAGPSNNVALASNGTIAIGSTEFGAGVHLIGNINDGLYGNSFSWISNFGLPDLDPWIGLGFPGETPISSIAWGRDNGNTVSDACGGTCTDRNIGIYTLQYTLVPAPDVSTPDTSEPFTGWANIGTIEYLPGADDADFIGYLRHRFEVEELGGPINASGFRIKVSDPGIAIDEIEVNPIPDPIPPLDLVLDITPETGFVIAYDGNEGNFNNPADPALVPANIAQSGVAFGSSEFGAGVHLIANINDGLYGNSQSWIANFGIPDPDPFIGIQLGAVTPITSIAWSRDNGNAVSDACGAACTDRALGVYTLQITTRTDADAATPDTGDAATGWQTLGTFNYKGNDPVLFNAYLRHRFDLGLSGGGPVQAAAIRIKVSDPGMAIDEIEINPNQVIEQRLLVTEPAPGFDISWDGNEGDFFSPEAISPAPANRALVSEGTIPFSSSDLGPELGIPFHVAANLNDGLYGNANSWISANGVGGTSDPEPFAGLNFGGSVLITNIAWGRDNGNLAETGCAGGTCVDRSVGTYLLQYTLVPDPDASTLVTDEPFTGWANIGTVTYGAALPPDFLPYLRHRYDLSLGGGPFEATGIRIVVPDGSTAIDEIEINTLNVEPPPDPPLIITPEAGFAIDWDGNEGNFNNPGDPAVVPENAAQSGTAFGSTQLDFGVHFIGNINDGLYGNANSWIPDFTLPDPDPFIGLQLGGLTPITSIAWGRDNGNIVSDACGGTCIDRALGMYTVQFTTRTDADAATPETGDAATGWQTLGTIHYRREDPILFTSYLRHRFDVSLAGGGPVEAAAIRILVSDPNMAIDEIEINPNQVIEQMLLVTEAAPGFTIGWDGNEGQFFDPTIGAAPPDNRALASTGTIPFTSSDLGPILGIPFHVAANLNDGLYGNGHSWISANGVGGTTDPDPFAGLNFGGSVLITNIAWGRDNGDSASEPQFTDRASGPFLLQYTLVPDPDASTPDTGEPFTGWANIGTVTYGNELPPIFLPYLRHRFELSAAGNPIEATGLRIKVPNGSTAIDEIEINTRVTPPPPVLPIVVTPAPGFDIRYDGNDGDFEDPSVGAGPPSNRALASRGTQAFGSSELADFGHFIAEVNDGLYGNHSSWISGPGLGTDPNPFIGLSFGGSIPLTRIAWSRDNGDAVTDPCADGTCTDRSIDLYTLQFTQVPGPGAATPETGDPATGWITLGTVDIQGSLPPLFHSWVRHEFSLGTGGAPIVATGIRIKVANNGTAIDEIEVHIANDPPIANDDVAVTNEDVPVTVDVLANDIDPDGDALMVIVKTGPTHGDVVLNPDGSITYIPALNFNGSDSFTYVVHDGSEDSEPGTVTLTVNPVNDPPDCAAAAVVTDEDVPVDLILPASDADGDALVYTIVDPPTLGMASVSGNIVTYTPAPNQCGLDTFRFKAVDPDGAEAGPCRVDVTVQSVNDAPIPIIQVSSLADLGSSVSDLILISPDNVGACATLDGSLSSDPDDGGGCGTGMMVGYVWLIDGVVVGTGEQLDVCLLLGARTVTLAVEDDAGAVGETELVVQVLTGGEAVEELILLIDDAALGRKNKQPLFATLKTAAAAFERGSIGSALNRLNNAFPNKLRAQVAKDNPDLAEEWIRIVGEIVAPFVDPQECEGCE